MHRLAWFWRQKIWLEFGKDHSLALAYSLSGCCMFLIKHGIMKSWGGRTIVRAGSFTSEAFRHVRRIV